MRHLAIVGADTNIDLRLTEPNWLQLGMNVSNVDQGHIAEGVKLQQIALIKCLLCRQLTPVAEPRCTYNRGCCHAGLQKVPTRYHLVYPI